MKKLLGIVLSLALILCAASAFAESEAAAPAETEANAYSLEEAGVTIQLLEGMIAEDMSDEEVYALAIYDEADPTVAYAYSLAYLEDLEGIFMEDLSEEDIEALVEALLSDMTDPVIDALENEGIYYLVISEDNGSALHYVSLLDGWLCDVAVTNVDGETLTDAQIENVAALLLGITYDEE